MTQRGPDQTISGVGGISSAEAFGTPAIWLTSDFAPLWFTDAVSEARKSSDPHARRREILFAVAAAESYLLEWVRDEVLQRDFHALDRYFPPGERRSITDKWKDISKQLHADGLIRSTPNLGGSTWQNFRTLVEFRNGLIHARASRPETTGLPEERMPLPTVTQLHSLHPGWAVQVVIQLIAELNSAAGTRLPTWLVAA